MQLIRPSVALTQYSNYIVFAVLAVRLKEHERCQRRMNVPISCSCDFPVSALHEFISHLIIIFTLRQRAQTKVHLHKPFVIYTQTHMTHHIHMVLNIGGVAKMHSLITSCVPNHLPNSASNVDYAKNYYNLILWTSAKTIAITITCPTSSSTADSPTKLTWLVLLEFLEWPCSMTPLPPLWVIRFDCGGCTAAREVDCCNP